MTTPAVIIITHFINLFCVILLIRSGLQILADHPKLYWTDDTKDKNYWLKFGKKKMPKDKLWTSLDEAEHIGSYALPGGTHNLGAARHWHFTTAIIWVATGAIYWGYMFLSGDWRRLVPTDLSVFSRAYETVVYYVQFQVPPANLFQPYDALQQLAYAGIVFVAAPLMILTGLAMSPALLARFPKYQSLFGGRRQVARSFHFLGMLAFSAFILIHVTMVALVYFYHNVRMMTLGSDTADLATALTVFVSALLLVLVFNVWATFFTLRHQARVRQLLTAFYVPVVRLIFGRLGSRQKYTKADISPFFRVNGYPPNTTEFKRLQADDFRDWKLEVTGLVEKPLSLSLSQIKALPRQRQITKHNCIQGWTAVGEWGGVRMAELMKLCRPKKKVHYVVFHCFDVDEKGVPFYESLRISDMLDAQTILAYEMNGKRLPVEHGAPLRLRCEQKYGYKMAKYIRSIEFVENFEDIGEGRGGYREDTVFFDWEASI